MSFRSTHTYSFESSTYSGRNIINGLRHNGCDNQTRAHLELDLK
jgi:hypothetical protein